MGESIEHLLFECEFAKRVWRASYFGFNFDHGNTVAFVDWFSEGIKSAPDKDVIRDSILLLWSIWCMRNEAVFRNVPGSIDKVLHHFSGTTSICRSVGRGLVWKGGKDNMGFGGKKFE